MGFSAKGYGDILLIRIEVCHPRVIYMQVEGCVFLDILIESELLEEDIYVCQNR